MVRIVILTVALLAGGGAAWLVYGAVMEESAVGPVAEAPAQIATTAVLVAAQPISRGMQLGPGNLRWQDWPKAVVGETAIERDARPDAIEAYTGWTSRTELLAGEPIRPERVVEGTGGLMSVLLTPGKRAVALPVSAETGAGGFVMPEDRVDLVHTVVEDADGDGTGEPISRTFISNVRVLAVDQMAEALEEGSAKVASTATLELTPEQVEALSNARNSGRLSLALRSVADFDEKQLEQVAVMVPEPEIAAAPPAPDAEQAQRRPAQIRIIGSGNVQTLEVDRREG